MPGREDDLPAFHARIDGIAWAKSELSPDGAGKNNLPLAGYAGLHRKNILPYQAVDPGSLAITVQRPILVPCAASFATEFI